MEKIARAKKGKTMSYPLGGRFPVHPARAGRGKVRVGGEKSLPKREVQPREMRKSFWRTSSWGGGSAPDRQEKSSLPKKGRHLPTGEKAALRQRSFGGRGGGASAEFVGAKRPVRLRKIRPQSGLRKKKGKRKEKKLPPDARDRKKRINSLEKNPEEGKKNNWEVPSREESPT